MLYLGSPDLGALIPRLRLRRAPAFAMPQFAKGVLEHLALQLGGRIKAHLVHDLGKRHVYVEIVLVDGVREPLGGPV